MSYATPENPILPQQRDWASPPYPNRYDPETGERISYDTTMGLIPAGLGQNPLPAQTTQTPPAQFQDIPIVSQTQTTAVSTPTVVEVNPLAPIGSSFAGVYTIPSSYTSGQSVTTTPSVPGFMNITSGVGQERYGDTATNLQTGSAWQFQLITLGVPNITPDIGGWVQVVGTQKEILPSIIPTSWITGGSGTAGVGIIAPLLFSEPTTPTTVRPMTPVEYTLSMGGSLPDVWSAVDPLNQPGVYQNLALGQTFKFSTLEAGEEVANVINTGSFEKDVFNIVVEGQNFGFDVTGLDMKGFDAYSLSPATGNILIEQQSIGNVSLITHEIEHRLHPTASESEIVDLTSLDLSKFSGIITPQLVSLGFITPSKLEQAATYNPFQEVKAQPATTGTLATGITTTPSLLTTPTAQEQFLKLGEGEVYNPFKETYQPTTIIEIPKTDLGISTPITTPLLGIENLFTQQTIQYPTTLVETAPILEMPKIDMIVPSAKEQFSMITEGKTFSPFTETYIATPIETAPRIDITADVGKMVSLGQAVAIEEYKSGITEGFSMFPEGGKIMEATITTELPKTSEFQSVLYPEPIVLEPGIMLTTGQLSLGGEISLGGVQETIKGGTVTETALFIKTPEILATEAKQQLEVKAEQLWSEAPILNKAVYTAQTAFSEKGFELVASLLPGGISPTDIIKGKLGEDIIAVESGKEVEFAMGEAIKSSYASIPGTIGMGILTGGVVGKGLAVVGSLSTKAGVVGEKLLMAGGGVVIGLEAAKVSTEVKMGVPTETIAAELLQVSTGFAAFGVGMKAGLTPKIETISEGFLAKSTELGRTPTTSDYLTTTQQYAIMETKAPVDIDIFGKNLKIGKEKIDVFTASGLKEGQITDITPAKMEVQDIQNIYKDIGKQSIKVFDTKGKLVAEEFTPESVGYTISGGKLEKFIIEPAKTSRLGVDVIWGKTEQVIPKDISTSLEISSKIMKESGKPTKIEFDMSKTLSRETMKQTFPTESLETISLRKGIEGGFKQADIGKLEEFRAYDIVAMGKEGKIYGKGEVFIPEKVNLEFKSDFGTGKLTGKTQMKEDLFGALKGTQSRLATDISGKMRGITKADVTTPGLIGFGGGLTSVGTISLGRGKGTQVSIARTSEIGKISFGIESKKMDIGTIGIMPTTVTPTKPATVGIDTIGTIFQTPFIQSIEKETISTPTTSTQPILSISPVFETPSVTQVISPILPIFETYKETQTTSPFAPITPSIISEPTRESFITPSMPETKTTSIISPLSLETSSPFYPSTKTTTETGLTFSVPQMYPSTPTGITIASEEEFLGAKPIFSMPTITPTKGEEKGIFLNLPQALETGKAIGLFTPTSTATPTIIETLTPTILETITPTKEAFIQKYTEPTGRSYVRPYFKTPPYLPTSQFLMPNLGASGGGIRRRPKKYKAPTRYTPSLVGTIFYPRIKKAPRDVGIAGVGIRPQLEGNVPKVSRGLTPPKSMFQRMVKSMFVRKPKNPQNEIAKKKYNAQFDKTVFGMDTRKKKK